MNESSSPVFIIAYGHFAGYSGRGYAVFARGNHDVYSQQGRVWKQREHAEVELAAYRGQSDFRETNRLMYDKSNVVQFTE